MSTRPSSALGVPSRLRLARETSTTLNEGSLVGRVALVTGGNAGIGFGMAKALAEAGADVAIWGTNSERNLKAKSVLEGFVSRQVFTTTCNVAEEDQVDLAFAATVAALGKGDIVFANAVIRGSLAQPWEISLEEWRRVQAVNLDGVFLTLRAGARHLVERGDGGALVVVSSTSAIHGSPATAAYATAKTGVLGLMRSFAVALAKHRVRVNALLPGWTDTEMLAADKQNQRFVDNTISRTPVHRWADPSEYGPVAVFLADPRNSFHTGDMIVVDGGYTIF